VSKISTLNLINAISNLGSMYRATSMGLRTVIKGVNITKRIATSARTARIIAGAGARASGLLKGGAEFSERFIKSGATLALMLANKAMESITEEPDLSGVDMEFYILEACMEIVPPKFEGTMIGLRVVYTLDSQLYGLAQTIAQYIDIDPSELWDGGANFNSDIDDIMSTILDLVESEIDNMGNQDRICKNFWNNRDLV
jgi:hypothetical protein